MQSPSIGALAAALAKAQAAFKPAIKDAANPFFKSLYLDLAGAIDACREALSSNGLAVVQLTDYANDKLVLNSMLLHSSGEFIGGSYPITPTKNDPQGMGAALTYARRYSFMALVGLAPDDDDGETASGKVKKTSTGEERAKKPTWTPEQTLSGGKARAAFMEIGGDGYVSAVLKRMAYDDPESVLTTLRDTIKHWTSDQKDEMIDLVAKVNEAEASLTLANEAAKWDWNVPADVIDSMNNLVRKL